MGKRSARPKNVERGRRLEAPLPEDYDPEDMDEFDTVMEAIKTSGYLSFHDEFDMVAADAKKRLIYDRKSPT